MKKILYSSLILFSIISIIVVLKDSLIIDDYLYGVISPLISDKLTKFIKVFTDIGSLAFSIIIIVIVSLTLYKYKKTNDLKWFLIILIIGNVMSFGLKLLFARERPDILVLSIENTFSFPSGHTFITTLLYGMILVLINKYYKNKYNYIYGIIYMLLVISIAFTRIYLGVHYFSDTLGGLFLGLFFLAIFYELVGSDINAKKMVEGRKNI